MASWPQQLSAGKEIAQSAVGVVSAKVAVCAHSHAAGETGRGTAAHASGAALPLTAGGEDAKGVDGVDKGFDGGVAAHAKAENGSEPNDEPVEPEDKGPAAQLGKVTACADRGGGAGRVVLVKRPAASRKKLLPPGEQ